MDWKECCEKRIVKEVREDEDFIESLIRKSEKRIKSTDKLELNGVTASSKLSLAYDSLRELLEALSIKHRYKIYNHACYTAFLKEILNKNNIGEEFDKIRMIRNSVNYYDKEITVNEAKEIIGQIKKLRKEILKLLE